MITIRKAKIKKNLFLEAGWNSRTGLTIEDHSISSTAVVHDDLKTAFNSLQKDFAEFTAQYGNNKKLDIGSITVTGFTISGGGETEGITLSGQRLLPSGQTLNINTPFILFRDLDGEVIEKIDLCKDEVYKYLFENKHQPDNQLSLFDDEEDNESEY